MSKCEDDKMGPAVSAYTTEEGQLSGRRRQKRDSCQGVDDRRGTAVNLVYRRQKSVLSM